MKTFTLFLLTGLTLAALMLAASGCDVVGDLLGNEKEAEGVVEEVGTDYLIVDAMRYEVNGVTKFEGIESLAGISVGDEVSIEYQEHGGTRLALEIEAKTPGGGSFTFTYDPTFNPGQFVASVTNPYYPLEPGKVHQYAGQTEDGLETITVEVLSETRVVAGVTTTVVHDQVFLDGELIEDTFDWYAQDQAGNVWYLGEDSKEYEDGQVVSTAGSWEAGVDGAEPGVIMPATPTVGQAYQQEFYAGEAEDRARVLAVNESVTVPYGSFTNCVKTEDTTPLEPAVLEYKYYCPNIGVALEVKPKEDNARMELTDLN